MARVGMSRVDRERLFNDHDYLLAVACHHFQQVDTYHRGLITFAGFSQALEAVGLEYGQAEVEDILQYCTITDDGYVHYKDLLREVAPLTPRAKQSTLKGTIWPDEEAPGPNREGSAGVVPAQAGSLQSWLAAHTDEIRKVYARWERGALSNQEFVEELRGLGVAVTFELEHYLKLYGPSRGMPFGKLMYALQVQENDGRRARTPHGDEGLMQPEMTKPSSAEGLSARSTGASFFSESASDLSRSHQTQSLRQAIIDFIDGRMPAVTFRQHLRRHAVPASPTLERLIRRHEVDNSVRFQEMACILLREGMRELQDQNCVDNSGGLDGEIPPSRRHTPQATPLHEAFSPPASSWRQGSAPSTGSAPFAFGGTWASGQPGGRSAALASEVTDDFQAVLPPYATVEELQDAELQRSLRAGLPRSSSSSRAQGHSGDIIGWMDRPSKARASVAPRPRKETFLDWPAPSPVGSDSALSSSRFGKRYYGRTPSAQEAAPFGRECDVGLPGDRRGPIPAPFGTDQDMSLRRPEDAGTDEYRACLRPSRRAF